MTLEKAVYILVTNPLYYCKMNCITPSVSCQVLAKSNEVFQMVNENPLHPPNQ